VHTEFWSENLNGTNHVEDIKMNTGELGWLDIDSFCSRKGKAGGCCEFSNEPTDFIKDDKFLD
jgi:hypothetical protein